MRPHSNIASMKKYLKTIVIILLNFLFCIMMFLILVRNSLLRPYAGSFVKESFSALLLIGSLYLNYFLLYPRIYQKYSYHIYWLAVVLMSIVVGIVDLAIAYPFIMLRNAQVIEFVGYYIFFLKALFFIIGRNLALNIFPYLFRERQQLRHSLEKEVQVVYQEVQKIDVTDKESNIKLLTIDDIFYCEQQRNFTTIHTVKNKTYTRLGSMKHLEQLLGEEEFIRITTTLLVPFQHIQSCKDNTVVMRQMPWQKGPTTFPLEAKTQDEVSEKIAEVLSQKVVISNENKIPETPTSTTAKRKPALPSEEKVREVLSYIEAHPNCNTSDIIAGTDFSLSTVERCLSELKKQGLIEHTGSKKSGGYSRVV